MRVNFHRERQAKFPVWLEKMFNEYMEEFRKEYQVSAAEVHKYFFDISQLDRIQNLFKQHNIDVEIYDVVGLNSKGIIIPDDNPIVVEYKLKYSE